MGGEAARECRDDCGVETEAGELLESFERVVVAKRWLVAPAGSDGGVGVGGGDDARFEWNSVDAEAVGVAGAVVAFVVVADAWGGVGEGRDAGDDRGADFGVAAEDLLFVVAKVRGTCEDVVGYRQFADVVEPARQAATELGGLVESQFASDHGGEVGDPLAMQRCLAFADACREREPFSEADDLGLDARDLFRLDLDVQHHAIAAAVFGGVEGAIGAVDERIGGGMTVFSACGAGAGGDLE